MYLNGSSQIWNLPPPRFEFLKFTQIEGMWFIISHKKGGVSKIGDVQKGEYQEH